MGDTTVPLFPLPQVFLFPYSVLPLHIFEPRYRQMIDHQLDRNGMLVLGTVAAEHHAALADAPPVLAVAGLGRMEGYKRLPDGRYFLQLVGESRVRVHEVESDHLYRLVEIELLQDSEPTSGRARELDAQLRTAIGEHSDESIEDALELSVGTLADILIQCLPVPPEAMVEYYGDLSSERRATMALELHRRVREA